MNEYLTGIVRSIKSGSKLCCREFVTEKMIKSVIPPLRLRDVEQNIIGSDKALELYCEYYFNESQGRWQIHRDTLISYVEDRIGEDFVVFKGVDSVFCLHKVEDYLSNNYPIFFETSIAA